jgi:hypothetical protein
MGRLREHWPIIYVCPKCALVRFCGDAGIESDEDCAQPTVRCHKFKKNATQRGLWQMNANRRDVADNDAEPSRDTKVRLVNPPAMSDAYETYLYLCDLCGADYTPRVNRSLYDILEGGPP